MCIKIVSGSNKYLQVLDKVKRNLAENFESKIV